MANEMRIKVKKKFLSPLTNRMADIGQEMNVPMSQFWFKRLQAHDCEKIKLKVKVKQKEKAEDMPKSYKGSK